jgi:hypothetical protein
VTTEDDDLDELPPEPHYKVEKQLRSGFPRARKRQRSGVSVDLRIYFREKPDGSLWGGVGMYSDDGERIEYMALDSRAGLEWLLSEVCAMSVSRLRHASGRSRAQAEICAISGGLMFPNASGCAERVLRKTSRRVANRRDWRRQPDYASRDHAGALALRWKAVARPPPPAVPPSLEGICRLAPRQLSACSASPDLGERAGWHNSSFSGLSVEASPMWRALSRCRWGGAVRCLAAPRRPVGAAQPGALGLLEMADPRS